MHATHWLISTQVPAKARDWTNDYSHPDLLGHPRLLGRTGGARTRCRGPGGNQISGAPRGIDRQNCVCSMRGGRRVARTHGYDFHAGRGRSTSACARSKPGGGRTPSPSRWRPRTRSAIRWAKKNARTARRRAPKFLEEQQPATAGEIPPAMQHMLWFSGLKGRRRLLRAHIVSQRARSSDTFCH